MNTKTRHDGIARAVAWGAVCGFRSMLGPALLGSRLRKRNDPSGTAIQRRLGSPAVNRSLELLAAGEMVADKTPFIPSRLSAASLAGRVLSGALVGASSAPPLDEAAASPPLLRAVAGAGAAVGAAFAGYHGRRLLRERLGLSNVASGMIEDGIVLWAASRIRDD